MVKSGEGVLTGGAMDDYDLDVLEDLPSYQRTGKEQNKAKKPIDKEER